MMIICVQLENRIWRPHFSASNA